MNCWSYIIKTNVLILSILHFTDVKLLEQIRDSIFFMNAMVRNRIKNGRKDQIYSHLINIFMSSVYNVYKIIYIYRFF